MPSVNERRNCIRRSVADAQGSFLHVHAIFSSSAMCIAVFDEELQHDVVKFKYQQRQTNANIQLVSKLFPD